MPTPKVYNSDLNNPLERNFTSGPNSNNHDWKLDGNVQVKVALKKLQIPNEIQHHNGHVREENSNFKSMPAPRGVKLKRMSTAQAKTQAEAEAIDPHLNSGEVMEELQKVVLDFEPECSICRNFVHQFSQHIHNLHSSSLPSSTSTRRPRSRGSGSTIEIETEASIGRPNNVETDNEYRCIFCDKSFFTTGDLRTHLMSHSPPKTPPLEIPSLTATEYVKCEPGEIEITDNDDLLYPVDLEGHPDSNSGSDFCTLYDDNRVKVERNDSHCESEFHSECSSDETIPSPPTKQQKLTVEKLKNVGSGVGKPYKCDNCETYFTRQDHVRRHALKKHPGELPYKCDVCQAGFKKFLRFTRHKKSHTREELEKSIENPSAVPHKTHKTISNDTEKETCTIVSVEELSPSNVEHETHSPPTPVPAQFELSDPISSVETETNYETTSHRRNLRVRKSISYAELNEGPPLTKVTIAEGPVHPSLTAENIKSKRRTDTLTLDISDNEDPLFNAEVDHESDSDNGSDLSVVNDDDDDSDSDFEDPEEKEQNGKPYKCDKCGSGFSRLGDKRRHILKQHPGVAPYECDVCKAGFTLYGPLTLHMKTHLVEKIIKIYKCKTCEFYGSPSDLVKHSKVHMWKKTHKCHTCGKIFMLVSHLIQHNRVHKLKRTPSKKHMGINSKKSHKCETCGKCFSTKCVLIMHKRLHTKKRPYTCEHCDKCFLSDTMRINHETKCADCKFCGQRFTESSVLNVHMATHTEEESTKDNPALTAGLKAKTCEKCDKSFYTIMSLSRHNYRVHNIESPATKKSIHRRFEFRRRTLKQRRRIQTDEEFHKCETCGKCFGRKDWLIRHEKLHERTYFYSFPSDARATRITYKPHQERLKTQCNICRVEFPTVKDLNAHFMLTHKSNLTKPYKCKICKSGFSASAKIRKHFLQVHRKINEPHNKIVNNLGSETEISPGYYYKCDHCSRTFQLPKHLELHMAIHTMEKPHKCETCEKSFYIKDALISHQRKHNGGQPDKRASNKNYGCGFCSTNYPTLHHLTDHLKRKHTDMLSNEYVCKFCKEDFFSTKMLNAHVDEVHPGEKPFECTICHKEFAKQYMLVEHSTVHKEEKTIPCTHKGCTKMFKNRLTMKRHLILHSGAKLYQCDECGKTFATSTGLNIHRKSHTGDKPFMCEVCSTCFSRKHSLHLHMLSHKEENGVKVKPHVCKDCGRGFTLKGQLTTHAKIHTGEKSHVCEKCGVCFRLPHQLRAHLKTLAHTQND